MNDSWQHRQFGQRMPSELVGEIQRAFEAVKDLPPVPHCFIARHDVPRGKLYRYWDTRGRLIVYVNRSSIESLPKKHPSGMTEAEAISFGPGMHSLWGSTAPLFGIPVRCEEVE